MSHRHRAVIVTFKQPAPIEAEAQATGIRRFAIKNWPIRGWLVRQLERIKRNS